MITLQLESVKPQEKRTLPSVETGNQGQIQSNKKCQKDLLIGLGLKSVGKGD